VRAIEESDVCMLLIDAQDGVAQQDLHIFSIIVRNGKGVVVVVNKWDLVAKDTKTAKAYEDDLKKRLAPFTDVPVIFTSVTEKQRIHKAMELAIKVYENRRQRIPTRKLNEIMLPEVDRMPPAMYKGKTVRIKYVTQLPGVVPAFAFFANLPQYIKESYARFLENKLREHFDFTGVPVRIFFRKK
jgi:GTP-binding protein